MKVIKDNTVHVEIICPYCRSELDVSARDFSRAILLMDSTHLRGTARCRCCGNKFKYEWNISDFKDGQITAI